jgi:hypothetical protein
VVDEVVLVLQQLSRGHPALRRRGGGGHGLDALPPEFGDSVEGLGRAPAAAQGGVGGLVGEGVGLDVALDAQRLRVAADDGAVLVQPVVLELGE